MQCCDRCGKFSGTCHVLIDSAELCLACGAKLAGEPRSHPSLIIAWKAAILIALLSLSLAALLGFACGLLCDASGELALLGPPWSIERFLICLLPASLPSSLASCLYAALARATAAASPGLDPGFA